MENVVFPYQGPSHPQFSFWRDYQQELARKVGSVDLIPIVFGRQVSLGETQKLVQVPKTHDTLRHGTRFVLLLSDFIPLTTMPRNESA